MKTKVSAWMYDTGRCTCIGTCKVTFLGPGVIGLKSIVTRVE